MGVFLFILFVSISFLIVRIGAVALQMTGMEWSRAKFQALSAFSGTGFTTSETETVVNHPRRRKIVTYLIIAGNAGVVSVIATFVSTLQTKGFVFRPSINLVIITVSLIVLYKIVSQQKIAHSLTQRINKTLRNRLHFGEVLVEELLQQPGGYGLVTVLIGDESKIIDLALSETGFTAQDLMVLSIERDDEVIRVPKANSKIFAGDRLLCYGRVENIKSIL
jgi:Trk-type K+ transport system membrane component